MENSEILPEEINDNDTISEQKSDSNKYRVVFHTDSDPIFNNLILKQNEILNFKNNNLINKKLNLICISPNSTFRRKMAKMGLFD